MKAYILDWQGTLNRLDDPLAFVRRLKDRGDLTIMYSGTSRSDQEFARVEEVCDLSVSKGGLTDLLRSLAHHPDAWTDYGVPVPSEFVISDDEMDTDPDFVRFLVGCASGISVRMVHPRNLERE